MGFMKRSLETARDEGIDAFYAGDKRKSPYAADDLRAEYWYEGFDYAQDMANMDFSVTEEQIQQMNGYWEDFYAGEKVGY